VLKIDGSVGPELVDFDPAKLLLLVTLRLSDEPGQGGWG